MVHLSRTVRFCLNDAAPGGDASASASDPRRHNGYAGWPAMRGLGRYYQLQVRCAGHADAQTGYFINIKEIDRAFACCALPYLQQLIQEHHTGDAALGAIMRQLLERLQPALRSSIVALRLELTPFYSLTLESGDMSTIVIRQQFDFAAAHRLHVPSLSDQENRDIFGKCNNPAGHGHNYRLEVAVRAPLTAQGRILPVEALDTLVDDAVIQKLDHKHLNLDVPQFAGLNPSVENIAKVIYEMLLPRMGELSVKLEEVSVWETEKTVCTYRG